MHRSQYLAQPGANMNFGDMLILYDCITCFVSVNNSFVNFFFCLCLAYAAYIAVAPVSCATTSASWRKMQAAYTDTSFCSESWHR